jgi:hypothetical protein
MTIEPGVGSLVLNPALDEDSGRYQCFVSNQCGTSVSAIAEVQRAYIEPFTKEEPKKMNAMVGKPLTLSCKSPRSVPDAVLSWILVSDNEDVDYRNPYQGGGAGEETEMFNSVPLGRRITMDYEGNLHFVRVEPEDALDGKRYVCMAANNVVRSYNQGEDKILNVIIGPTSTQNNPSDLEWHSQEHNLVLEGRRARFKCIFSGNPDPTVVWKRKAGGPMDEARMKQSSDMHEFIISDVKMEDAGEYECLGKNSMVPDYKRQTFTLKVECESHHNFHFYILHVFLSPFKRLIKIFVLLQNHCQV